ncbi:sporulation integral membrane protein YtvI [Mammaliicoccus sp. Dog046]|uniref:sporulation integral membrane protein YtvI n=1 Tax=Mammaliicoccus sp. Dog046 TaxID=3034233 RepID=UPI002B25A261|nr:sporulation integral membrane protein YtvI [Mammaliicoccus sp. Dog046]WQK84682.1 sporulation integral membrane protein YtvI [Mammaliicoccus sp. Dog046]
MKKWINKRNISITIIIILAILFIYFILPISIPLITAMIIALAFNPLVNKLEVKIKSRKWSVTLIYTALISITGLAIFLFLTKLYDQIALFIEDLPKKINKLIKIIEQYNDKMKAVLPDEMAVTINKELQNVVVSMRDSISNYISVQNITEIVSSLPGFIISLVVFLVALFLFMLEVPNIHRFIKKHLYPKTYRESFKIYKQINHSIVGMLSATVVLSFITWVFTYLGLLIIGVDSAFVISLFIWLVDLLPIVGATGLTIPWAIYAYIVGDATLGIQLIILSIVLLIQRKILEPKIFGTGVGLSPLPTLISMFIGLKLLGFLGFFIGPLFLIVIKTILDSGLIKTDFKI